MSDDKIVIIWQSAYSRKRDRGWDFWRCVRYADRHTIKARIKEGTMTNEERAETLISMLQDNYRCSSTIDKINLVSAYADEIRRECDGFRMDELDAVMISVDKWFEQNDPRLKLNPATRSADARNIALCAIESTADEIRRECAENARNAIFDFGIGDKEHIYSPIIRKDLAAQLVERAIIGKE